MNRLPSSILENKSSDEILFTMKPLLSRLRVIGCLCYASVVPKNDKFSERVVILMGYSELQKS